jgi:immune inhibitor A
MKKKFLFTMIVGILLTTFIVPFQPALIVPVAAGGDGYMPPNPDLIIPALMERGIIPADATPEETYAIYQEYIERKLGRGEKKGNPLAEAQLKAGEESGKPQNNHGRVMRPNNTRFDNILTLIVEFAGTDDGHTGPLHNEMPEPTADDNINFWVPDFSPEHYYNMLFNRSIGARSMSTYFLEQSGYRYSVDGQVYGWVQVDHSEWYYGADDVTGSDNLNGPVWRVVEDAVANACDVPWEQFDTEDPYDLDLDGVYSEPDGYVDHIQIIHAGADQAGGGGAQGDDAIWSHSWWADFGNHGPGYGGVPTCGSDVWVGPYTINPETIYSGEASTGFWTNMASGSWLGCPGEALGTCPPSLNVWEKWVLGWLDPITIYPGQVKSNITLKTTQAAGSANKAIQVRLPDYSYEAVLNRPYSGVYEWYSNKGNSLSNTLTNYFDLLPTDAVLSFMAWYDIELDYDYGYVEVSTDYGTTWTTVAGNITTDTDPNDANDGHGITGNSYDIVGNVDGWVSASFDMSAYGGQVVMLRFRYETDLYVINDGFAIDDIGIDGFFDDVEAGEGGWTSDGWTRMTGTDSGTTFHYYMAEWRTPTGFDVSMDSWYNYLYGNTVEFFSGHPGMLVWYRNGRYGDNHVGVHPWAGQLLLVDSHPELVIAEDIDWYYPFRTRIQIADAAFGLTPIPAQHLTSWGGIPTDSYLPALDPVATFDDSVDYTDRTFEPWLGLGLRIR